MKKDGFYSSGEFAKMAHITKKTLRYYDAHNILKPSYLTPYACRKTKKDKSWKRTVLF